MGGSIMETASTVLPIALAGIVLFYMFFAKWGGRSETQEEELKLLKEKDLDYGKKGKPEEGGGGLGQKMGNAFSGMTGGGGDGGPGGDFGGGDTKL